MEAQLTCAICTDVLYQPVQLHDCEHYFCGWCVREWLRHHPSCPTCRRRPTRTGQSRLIDNMLEAFLEEHQDLAPTEERRAEHASYTLGEDILSPLSERSNGFGTPATGQSSPLPAFPPIGTASHSSELLHTLLSSLLSNPGSQTPWVGSATSSASPAANPVAATSRGLEVPSIRHPNEEVEEIPRLPLRQVRRAVTPSAPRPVISERRSVTPYSTSSPLLRTPTLPHSTGRNYRQSYYSTQPISVNNYTVHNHYCNRTPATFSPSPPAPSSGVIVNGVPLDAVAISSLTYSGVNLVPGRYWYDDRSGLWGYEGYPSSGVLQAGLRLGGWLCSHASGATLTHIYANGRELPLQDLARLRDVGITPVPGQRLWINADGSCGLEGSPLVYGNIFMANGFTTGVRLGAFMGGLLLRSLFR